jgi:predicted RNase H-like HicB family nuclease
MSQYIAVLMPLETGGWRAYFPDLVGCGREGDDGAAALDAATKAAKDRIAQLPNEQAVPSPQPRSDSRGSRMG